MRVKSSWHYIFAILLTFLFSAASAESPSLPSDFWKTEAKYKFLRTFSEGATVDSNPGFGYEMQSKLAMLYDMAKKGNPVAINGIDSMFDQAVELYPKNNPLAQYNLGITYDELKEHDKALYWYEKSAEQRFEPAIRKLLGRKEGIIMFK